MSNTRRNFIKQSAQVAAGTYIASLGFSAKSYGRIVADVRINRKNVVKRMKWGKKNALLVSSDNSIKIY